MTLHIYDGMNVVRRRLDEDDSGRAPRKFLNEMSAPGNHIWVWDGAGGKARRQELYPNYKANRQPQPDGIWRTIELVQQILSWTPALQITVKGFEADDVIAHVAQVATEKDILVHSSDRDLQQLAINPRVRGTWKALDMPAEDVRLYKTWVGDPSDDIKGVPGFGEQAWAKANKAMLRAYTLHESSPIDVLATLPPRSQTWLKENERVLRALWTITGFLPLPDQLDSTIIAGVPNYDAADKRLREFLQ